MVQQMLYTRFYHNFAIFNGLLQGNYGAIRTRTHVRQLQTLPNNNDPKFMRPFKKLGALALAGYDKWKVCHCKDGAHNSRIKHRRVA